MQAKAPFPWYGGKQYIADRLVSLLPPHDSYVEVFGGAGSLLFSKPASKLECYNDLDSGLVNFFRVLRDPAQCRQLTRLLDYTPYAREEWESCRDTWQDATDGVEMARRWYTAIQGSFGKHLGASGTGWSTSVTPGHSKAQSFRTAIADLERFSRRLSTVQIEHGPFERIFAAYDTPRTLFYCDPPYLPETRQRADRYRHEMNRMEHMRLLDGVKHLRGMALVSGYRDPLYDDALADWRRVDITVRTWAANRTRQPRTECIWLSPSAAAHQPTLWQRED